jgi:hypothetical protein
MTELAERLDKLQDRVDRAVETVRADPKASPVLMAVVDELARKMGKARMSVSRESVVEVEQAADSAKYAAQADPGLGDEARHAIVEAHDRICILKAKM